MRRALMKNGCVCMQGGRYTVAWQAHGATCPLARNLEIFNAEGQSLLQDCRGVRLPNASPACRNLGGRQPPKSASEGPRRGACRPRHPSFGRRQFSRGATDPAAHRRAASHLCRRAARMVVAAAAADPPASAANGAVSIMPSNCTGGSMGVRSSMDPNCRWPQPVRLPRNCVLAAAAAPGQPARRLLAALPCADSLCLPPLPPPPLTPHAAWLL